jgi:hypothetical protein
MTTPRQKKFMGKSKVQMQAIITNPKATVEVTLVLVLHVLEHRS